MIRVQGSNVVFNLFGPGKSGFRSKDTVGGIPGTVLTAQICNYWQEELCNVVEMSGASLNSNYFQVAQAIRSQRMNFVGSAGVSMPSASQIALTMTPIFGALAELTGMPIHFLSKGNSPAGGMTVSVNGFTAQPLVWGDGSPILAGEIELDELLSIRYDGINFILQKALTPLQIRALPSYSLEANSATNNITSVASASPLANYGSVSNKLRNSTFSGGVLTIGSQDAGLYAVSARLNTNLPRAGTSGTAAAYSALMAIDRSTDGGTTWISQAAQEVNSQSTSINGPFMGPSAIIALAAGHRLRMAAGQNSGVTLNFPVALTVANLGR